jgi:hypothetical protein
LASAAGESPPVKRAVAACSERSVRSAIAVTAKESHFEIDNTHASSPEEIACVYAVGRGTFMESTPFILMPREISRAVSCSAVRHVKYAEPWRSNA